jgi:DNA-binding MarR family transcriptional regulator
MDGGLDRQHDGTADPVGDLVPLRVWLRLLACANQIEADLRRRLRAHFDVTLPRFDLMAQLAKAPDGLTMGALSRSMMVSNGNVTGIADRLAADGLIERIADPADKRTIRVRLTKAGRDSFAAMARVHHGWVAELFADLDPPAIDQLNGLLGRLRGSVSAHLQEDLA